MEVSILFGSLLALALIEPCPGQVVNFDHVATGALPRGWTVAMTHEGGPPKWEVLRDDSAPSKPNVFAQTSNDSTAGRFPLAIWDGANIRNGIVSVKFKPVSGVVDQGAGVIWRYRDPKNYYIARANALENNIVLYKVQNGERISLSPRDAVSNAYGVKHKVPKQTWSTLSVGFHGRLFTVSLNDQKIFDAEDSTFTEAGKTGLWTKADSVICFDDFQAVDDAKK